jgi:hypothetical protein
MQTNPYHTQGQKVLALTKKYLSQYDWTHVYTNDNGTSLKKKVFKHTPFPCFISEATINKPFEELVKRKWLVNELVVKNDDPEIKSWYIVDSGDEWKVCHQINNCPWPIWSRELVFAQVKIVDGTTVWLVAFSVDRSDVKIDQNNNVKAVILMSVWSFTPISKNQTKVQRIVHVDPKGLIPAFLVDSTVDKHIKIIDNLNI